jgi:twitching motility protein PilT
MSIETWVREAYQAGASDLHLEPGLPRAYRVDGKLRFVGQPIQPADIHSVAQDLVPDWRAFLERRSADLSRRISGVQCRINVLQTWRGVGMAVRLLAAFQPTLQKLNLHPDLGQLVRRSHGLVLVCGATGSGKSSTLAALMHELDQGVARHVLTLEEPIEYVLRGKRCLFRQREVGQHTPSFEQGLLDALREDPDVLLVGELRRARTMQLTLDAAETGHLVLATMHSSSAAEALQRLVACFPSEAQNGVRVQLADCLAAVVCQRLSHRPEQGFRVPELELLVANPAVRNHVRSGDFHKLNSTLELGAGDGMWSLARYRRWLDQRGSFVRPKVEKLSEDQPAPALPRSSSSELSRAQRDAGTIDLDGGGGEDLESLIAQIERRGR